jgi:hypothetical protein
VIAVDCEQGSWTWKACRLAIPTASEFARIVTPKQLKPGTGADTYLTELLAEWATGQEASEWVSPWAERGKELEPEARRFMALALGQEIRQVGFIYRDDERLCGCSPDGLGYDAGVLDAGVELKCPAAKTHIRYMLRPGALVDDYLMQIQGGLWVTDLPRWHVCSYHPGLPPVLVEVTPDDEVMDALDRYVPAFTERLKELREKLREMGVEPRLSEPDDVPEWALPSVDIAPLDDTEMERFEALRRQAEPEESDRLVQLAVNGSWRAVRDWMRRVENQAVTV